MSAQSPPFLDALRALWQGLDELGAPAMIIGGVAVIALGVPRLTVDIDATVSGKDLDVDRLVEALGRRGIRPRRPDAVAFARKHHVLLLSHQASGTPVDLSLAWLPFEDEALGARREQDYAGVRIRVPRPEDLVVYKLVAARPQDLDDAEGLLLLHGADMKLDRVRRLVRQFAQALEDSDRPAALERLIRKARRAGTRRPRRS